MVYQVGVGGYKPNNSDVYEVLNKKDYIRIINSCNLMITHCGTGSLIASIQYEKPIICMPRMEKFGEHRNDHQVAAAQQLNPAIFTIINDDDDLLETANRLLHNKAKIVDNYLNIIGKKFVNDLDDLVEKCLKEIRDV